VTVSHRRTRSAGLVLSTAVLGAALLGVAPAAQATDITNPSEHPDPITLTIDGQTYRDGADTLPGYDDYACTPIPNVEYDFADDQIQYYDGRGELIKIAHWTEWSRISSYETWVAQQQAGKPSSPAPTGSANATPSATTTTTTSTATTTPAGTGPAATSPATTSPETKSTATRTTTSAPKTQRAAAKTTSSATKNKGSATETKSSTRTSRSSRGTSPSASQETASSRPEKRGTSSAPSAKRRAAKNRSTTATPAASGTSADGTDTAASSASPSGAATTTQGTDAPSSTASPAATPKFKLVSDKGVGSSVADTRPIGVGILAAVFGVVCLAFLFGSARRRGLGRVA
jgi:hypothetical protein